MFAQPVKGTVGVCVPYSELVPFLDKAGMFIGVRSGLCDIIATSTCKKVVIHTYRNGFWPDGRSISYTGLQNIELCNDVVEMEYKETEKDSLLQSVIDAAVQN